MASLPSSRRHPSLHSPNSPLFSPYDRPKIAVGTFGESGQVHRGEAREITPRASPGPPSPVENRFHHSQSQRPPQSPLSMELAPQVLHSLRCNRVPHLSQTSPLSV